MNVQVRDGGAGIAERVRLGWFAFLAGVVLPCLLYTLHLTPNYSNQLSSQHTAFASLKNIIYLYAYQYPPPCQLDIKIRDKEQLVFAQEEAL